jgi:hypothetical protein
VDRERAIGPFALVEARQLLSQATGLDAHRRVLLRIEARRIAVENLDGENRFLESRSVADERARDEIAKQPLVARRAPESADVRAAPVDRATITLNGAEAREISTCCFWRMRSSSACVPGRCSSAVSTYAAGPSLRGFCTDRLLFS